ncbi:MAG: hypothetical protein OZ921_06590 [Sorangiineae bacterium]|nr:hypothetical protein [Polyangiaceae bacterium]MEB2322162.1 hypothetical protein [Sorangiineae bacterium]
MLRLPTTPVALCALLLMAPSLARAAEPAADWDGGFSRAPAERRSGVTIGAATGLLGASAVGYPNQLATIDDPAYRASTGLAVGARASLWLGGALTDWFSLGLGLDAVRYRGGGLAARGSGFIFRMEGFPLFAQGGPWRDVGVAADFGLAGLTLEEEGEERASGGSMSLLGVGAFWETWRPGGIAIGPVLEYEYVYSPSLRAHSVVAGFRFAFYGGP